MRVSSGPSGRQTVLELASLSKSFGANKAVDDLSISVEKGTIHGLIGPNGSGKSTTMNMVSGFYEPNSGSVSFDSQDIAGLASHVVARQGLVRTFQITHVFGSLPVFEAVRIGALASETRSWSLRNWLPFDHRHASNERAHEAIRHMGLENVARTQTGVLPGGLQRIVSIATALAGQPRMLLLDEPLAGLNATEKAAVAERIELLRSDGLTIMLVEHDVRSVMKLCDMVSVINFGRLIESGPPAQVSNSEAVVSAYLGTRRERHA